MQPDLADQMPLAVFRRTCLLALETRGLSQLGLRSLSSAPDTHERQATAAKDPVYIANLNAFTVIQIFGAIEAYIEEVSQVLKPVFEDFNKEHRIRVAALRELVDKGVDGLETTPDMAAAMREVLNQIVNSAADLIPADPIRRLNQKLPYPERWESALKSVHLGAPKNRPLPTDLVSTLLEIAAVRNALVHNAGRATDKTQTSKYTDARHKSPWNKVGDVINIDKDVYRIYIAALWTYVEEMSDRFFMILQQPPSTPSLEDWRANVPAGG